MNFPQHRVLFERGIIHGPCLTGREIRVGLSRNLWEKFTVGSTFLTKLDIHSLCGWGPGLFPCHRVYSSGSILALDKCYEPPLKMKYVSR